MDEKRILLPYNFSKNDKKALEFVIQHYAGDPNVSVTVLHIYPPVPEIVVNRDSVMNRMSDSVHYLRSYSAEQEYKVKKVKEFLEQGGFGANTVNYLYVPKKRDIAQEIGMLVRQEGYNIVVLTHTGGVTGFFKASVFNKVVTSIKDICVMILT